KTLPSESAALTLLTAMILPLGSFSEQSTAVNVDRFIGRSNVTRTLLIVLLVGPIATLETTCGADVEVAWTAPTAGAASTMPPEATLPARAEDLSAVARIWEMTWRYVQVGFFDHTSAATPVTNGVAIEVPLLSP